jgi:prepilin-type N-terminal cleavage/methylation domain-containing protein
VIGFATFGGGLPNVSFAKGFAAYDIDMISTTTHQASMKTPLPAVPRPFRRRPTGGFTLIELMVTVAIVGILAAIAYPSYRNYVIRGQLVSATNMLSSMRADMERYFQDNRTYMQVGAITPPCATAVTSGTFTTTACTGGNVPTATTFTLTATGSGNTAGFVFTVDNTNVQGTTVASPAPSSWTTGSPFACWITKPGGC